MSQVDRIYKKAFRKNFTNHEANFPPTVERALGDYGVFKNGYFSRIGNVMDKGIQFEINPDNNPTHESFKSSNDVTLEFVAKGQVNPIVNAKLNVSYGSSNVVFFSSAQVKYDEIKNIEKLGEEVLELYKNGKWRKEYFIVTRIFGGKNTLILISGSSDCKISIEADADVPQINLADAEVGLEIRNSSKASYEIAAKGFCTIGMGFSRIYDNIFIKPGFKTAMNSTDMSVALDHNNSSNVVFGDVAIGEEGLA